MGKLLVILVLVGGCKLPTAPTVYEDVDPVSDFVVEEERIATGLYRFENHEVTCYTSSAGLQCEWKYDEICGEDTGAGEVSDR